MNPVVERRILYALLTAYVLLGAVYSVVSPVFEVSDELWHYPMVKYLADHGLQLPPQDPANPGLWRQEGSQPPLYYLMSAVLTAGIDTSDLETVRRQNLHADIGIIRPDGNANMMAHRPAVEAFPWHGTVLAVHIIRFFSVALGLGTVLVAYQLGREIFPDWPLVALGAAGLTAFLPMFLFISGSVNNDNLSNLLGNLLTLLVVRLLKRKTAPGWRTYALIGIVAGAGLLAKLNIGFLIPLVGLALLVVSLRLRDWRPVVIGGLISGVLTVIIAGWWYWHNWQTYNDPTGLNMFLQMVGRRAIPANAAQLWSERHSFTQAYWGFFGGVNVALPEVVYLIFNIIGGIGLLGGIVFIAFTLARRRWSLEQWLPAAVTILWPAVTFISYLRWTAETPASQGRLVFGALSSIALWMAVGLAWWLPKRIHPIVISVSVGFFALVTVLTPFLVIAPAYALPETLPPGDPTTLFADVNGGAMGLLDARILTDTAHPEEYAFIEMDWQIVQPVSRNWSLFVHLVTPDNVIVGQRDIYPGGGKLATSDLAAGYAWRNPVAVWLPPAAYAPMTLSVEIGWYDLATGERLTLPDGGEILTIGQVELQPRSSTLNVPNPIRVNFNNQVELVGYSLSDLSPQAGDTVELTLYWRAMQKVDRDYVVFAHIIDPPTLTIYAGSDAMPVQWTAPTSTWIPGEVITDVHTLTLREDTPPSIYELEIGLYTQEPDGSFPRPRIVTPDGGMADDFTYLNRVRVLPRG
ncbi:MAG: glycosyltransferase family 39 protein [Anaerolineae bacterium]|nr:glycosyltransferase family 39 protein [Anaerolineae bacterium]